MIVDDEEKIRAGISSYFPWDELGFSVIKLAADGQEAFDFMLGDERVDVILCDIMMPVVNGMELLEMMEESGMSGVKVVLLSGYREFEYAHKAIRFGVRDYLLKPTKYKELYATFSKLKQDLDEEARLAQPLAPEVPAMDTGVINQLKSLIYEQYRTLSLQQAADIVHMNPYYLSRLFKQKTGQNFYELLLKVRMDAAAELLTGSDHRIYEISEMVGYKNPKSFLKIFKRFYGMNPTDYRREHIL
ncbi:MAG: response regulator [Provencibacterium sp.]|jgi:two-component system response regulator YesN|nr:response regulator [Provencibacterium sp.]